MDSKFKDRVLISELWGKQPQEEVKIAGFIQEITKFKNLTTLLLRDSSGIISVSFLEPIGLVKRESVVLIKGKLTNKTKNFRNRWIFDLYGNELELLSQVQLPIPIELGSGKISDEKFRMRYRYLDLRRQELKNNLIFASRARNIVSNYLHKWGYIELDTPILSFPSNEGAQTFSTLPTDSVKSSFTLAQSPQLYKQLLMLSGFEKYFQFAKSFRAEELREDRQYEFTQLDIELSFSYREKLFETIENLLIKIIEELPKEWGLRTSFESMSYLEAITKYGTDKPDLRNSLKIFDLFKDENYHSENPETECCYSLQFESFDKDLISWLDTLAERVRYLYRDSRWKIQGKYDNFLLSLQQVQELPEDTYLIYTLSPKLDKNALFTLGRLREKLFKKGIVQAKEPNKLCFLWITDWNYFERDREGNLKTVHHPFALPGFDSIAELLNQDSLSWKSTSYDLVLNGAEIASGSQRITDPELQREVFKRLGYTDEELQREFGWFLEAFKFGAPPHLGIAIGWERLIATLLGTISIRDVIPFPKNSKGNCSMSNSH